MNKKEAQLFIPLLNRIYDELSDQTCGDWELPNTKEGRALWEKINQWEDPANENEWMDIEHTPGKPLNILDSAMIGYLRHYLESLPK